MHISTSELYVIVCSEIHCAKIEQNNIIIFDVLLQDIEIKMEINGVCMEHTQYITRVSIDQK